jgi:hypothetical protein
MLRTILILTMLAGLTLTAAGDPAAPADLPGFYICNGTNGDGTSYRAVVEIAKQHDSYVLRWFVDSDVVAVGLGIRTGDVLSVAYFSASPGVIAFRIEPGNRLVGEWTLTDADGLVFSETLTRTPDQAGPARSPSRPADPTLPDQGPPPQREVPASTPGREL